VSEPECISGLTLQDFSALPRFGLKGVNTQAWLDAQGFTVGRTSNRAYPQDNGCLAARLSPRELFFLCDPQRPALSVDHDYFSPGRNCYMVRRQDSHYWFAITGKKSPSLLAKLCGVNFDPRAFTDGRVAQTQVARTSAIVVRNDIHETLCYYLLGDSSYFTYMQDCVSDAMHEFGGRILGTQATNTSRN
jgi:sarcosine oxidase, subunit gamma